MTKYYKNMFYKALHEKFDYSLIGKSYKPESNQRAVVYSSSIDRSYWKKRDANTIKYKNDVRLRHYFGQNLRCAYCRCKLRADAYWEDLDHVVAQTIKENWIFYPKNLIVTCTPCNRLKNADVTLSNPNAQVFPSYSKGFTIFNPHFDTWSDHFEVINGLFLKGKAGTKGPDTYKHCHLHRHDIIIEYSDEQRIWSIFTMRRLTHRLKESIKGSPEEEHIKKAIEHIINKQKLSEK